MAMTRVYLVRHGEAEGNVYRRLQGQYNSKLTPNGLVQLERLRERCASLPLDAVYASNLRRAWMTAQAVVGGRDIPLVPELRFQEMYLSEWEDVTFGFLAKQGGTQWDLFMKDDPAFSLSKSETFPQVARRASIALQGILEKHEGGSVAVVSHGLCLSMLARALLGEQAKELGHLDNASLSCLLVGEGRVELEFWSDNAHLGELSTLAKQSWWRKNPTVPDMNLWYRPVDLQTEEGIALAIQRRAWYSVYNTYEYFSAEGALEAYREMARTNPRCVQFVMLEDTIVGLLLLNQELWKPDNGHIALICLEESYQNMGLGIQLIGEAVSYFRRQGKKTLTLRVWPQNGRAMRFYARAGFEKTGTYPGSFGPLDVLRLEL